MKLTFKKEPDVFDGEFMLPNRDTTVVTTEVTNVEVLDDVLKEFETFLKGVGFHFNGTLEIVNELDSSEEE